MVDAYLTRLGPASLGCLTPRRSNGLQLVNYETLEEIQKEWFA